MKVSVFTSLINELNRLLDSGTYDDITVQDVKDAIRDDRLFAFLEERTRNDIDLSIHRSDVFGDFERLYSEFLRSMLVGYGSDTVKWGVQRKGLCLLLAWTNEIVQKGQGWHAPEPFPER